MGIETEGRYIPAARWRAFTRLYDPVLALTLRERRFRSLMRRRVASELPSEGVTVDVGCGTGTFAIGLARERADALITGVDGDPEVLALARGKDGSSKVEWREGLAQSLPIDDAAADVVTTSLVIHHLLPGEKGEALAEMKRVLRPGGRLHVADWGVPHDPLMSGLFYVAQAVDGFERTREHRAGRLPELIDEAGFEGVERYGRLRTGFGSLDLWTAGA
jgi:SAM-dependent methyltransferase